MPRLRRPSRSCAPDKANMGATAPGAKCCSASASPPVPPTLYKGKYLCGSCAQDGEKCAAADECCSGAAVQDVTGQSYCGCAPDDVNMGAADPQAKCCAGTATKYGDVFVCGT